MVLYGYCRTTSNRQIIEVQEKKILERYPNSKIFKDKFNSQSKEVSFKELKKLKKKIKTQDFLILESILALGKNPLEIYLEYTYFFKKGVNLIFLREPFFNSNVYSKDLNLEKLEEKEYFYKLLQNQIIAYIEKKNESKNKISQNTKLGLSKLKKLEFLLGRKKGQKIETLKSIESKNRILELSKDFNGALKDIEIIEILKISRNTYYKYKKELLNNPNKYNENFDSFLSKIFKLNNVKD